MISILIPVYNYSVVELLKRLKKQIIELNHEVEIIVWDDASSDKDLILENKLACKEFVATYIASEENKGRAEARNILARKASYEWLLFLDADVYPVYDDFLYTYLSLITENTFVFAGNIIYKRDFPKRKENLRWQYGVKHEEISLKRRKTSEYLQVKSANLLIHKSTFLKTGFPVLKYNYGWEDTLLGLELHQKGIKIKTVENPVYHEGLEDNVTFLNKTEESLKNLVYLVETQNILCQEFRIFQIYMKLKKTKIEKPFLYFFKKFKNKIKKQVLSDKPKVELFQIYKLGYFCELLASKKISNKLAS